MLQISSSVEQRRYLGEFLWKRMALFRSRLMLS
jgi:hypothetical protein